MHEPPTPQRPTTPTAAPRRRKPKPVPTLARHRRKCTVCRHPDRDAIEQDYLHWHSPDTIAGHYHIADHSSIYRHAYATGLFDRRRAHVRVALAHIIENAHSVRPNANAVISAVCAYAHINAHGQWIHSNRQTKRVEHAPTP